MIKLYKLILVSEGLYSKTIYHQNGNILISLNIANYYAHINLVFIKLDIRGFLSFSQLPQHIKVISIFLSIKKKSGL